MRHSYFALIFPMSNLSTFCLKEIDSDPFPEGFIGIVFCLWPQLSIDRLNSKNANSEDQNQRALEVQCFCSTLFAVVIFFVHQLQYRIHSNKHPRWVSFSHELFLICAIYEKRKVMYSFNVGAFCTIFDLH